MSEVAYIVVEGQYDARDEVAVYTSRAAAERNAKARSIEAFVEERPLDVEIDAHRIYYVEIDWDTGDEVRRRDCAAGGFSEPELPEYGYHIRGRQPGTVWAESLVGYGDAKQKAMRKAERIKGPNEYALPPD